VTSTERVPAERLCRLATAIGETRPCPREGCPFWEPGGAVLEGRCAFEHVDVTARPELAELLLDLRSTLQRAAAEEEQREPLRLLHHLLNEASE
jgi:hypothetical protein